MDKKQSLEQRLKDFFANKTNENVNKVYVTSDENIFKAEHYADDWSKTLVDKKVTPYTRFGVEGKATDKAVTTTDNANTADTDNTGLTAEKGEQREQLVKRYIELFDTKPDGALTDEALADLIAAKVAETDENGTKKEPVATGEKVEPTADEKAATKAKYIELTGKKPTGKTYEQQLAIIAEKQTGK